MSERLPLDSSERQALCEAPPRDDDDRLVPWTLSRRAVAHEGWTHAVEHEGLTLSEVSFNDLRWSGAAVFRRCTFHEVSFTEVVLEGLRFEDVTFERCQFETVQMKSCELVRCRFVGGAMDGWQMKRSTLQDCAMEGALVEAWTLVDCRLEACAFCDSALHLFRPSKCTIEGVTFRGGELGPSEWSFCQMRGLGITKSAVYNMRFLDGELWDASFSELRGEDLTFSVMEMGTLSFRGGAWSALRVVGGRLSALRIEQCSSVQGLSIHDCALGDLTISGSTLYDTTFELVESSGATRFLGSTFVGLFFKEGTWAKVQLGDARLEDYLAVERAHFVWLERGQMREAEGLRRRLEGDDYGAGSMTWRGPHGT